MQEATTRKRTRLQPLKVPTIEPFLRAAAIEDCSVYWLGVREFPIPLRQREWLRAFLKRLAVTLRDEYALREEWFLQFKALYPDLLNRFIDRSSEYVPMTGMTLIPNSAPVGAPVFEDVKRVVEESTRKGTPVDVTQWMPDQAHWFAMKAPEKQREDFFGYGGMFSLYLKQDPKTAELPPKLPRFITSHPAYNPESDRQYAMLMSLRDGFLAKSKEMFGKPFQQDPSYRGLLFVLPLLTGSGLVSADPEARAEWFELFDGYCIESKPDRGILLVCKDPEFDKYLVAVLESMRDDNLWYWE